MIWKVSNTASVSYGRSENGYCFNIINEHDRPIVTFIYGEEEEADVASHHIRAAIENARAIVAGRSL